MENQQAQQVQQPQPIVYSQQKDNSVFEVVKLLHDYIIKECDLFKEQNLSYAEELKKAKEQILFLENKERDKTISTGARLQKVRAELMEAQIKKTGKNGHMNYDYLQLEDFLPELVKSCNKHGIYDVISFDIQRNLATIKIINVDNPYDKVDDFNIPLMMSTNNKQPVQNIGATITYYRRYLYQLAFNIVVNDEIDSDNQAQNNLQQQNNGNINKLIEMISSRLEPNQINGLLKQRGKTNLNQLTQDDLVGIWNSINSN